MKVFDPQKIVDLAPHMIEEHLKQAAHWTLQLAELANPHDREAIRRQFEHQCQQTVYKLRGQLQWKK